MFEQTHQVCVILKYLYNYVLSNACYYGIVFIHLQVGDIQYELVEGDPRNALCDAAEKHQAEILVVGSHGYGAIKRSINCILVHGFNALSSHLRNILIDFC